jgi:hypothetical protein
MLSGEFSPLFSQTLFDLAVVAAAFRRGGLPPGRVGPGRCTSRTAMNCGDPRNVLPRFIGLEAVKQSTQNTLDKSLNPPAALTPRPGATGGCLPPYLCGVTAHSMV